MKTTARFDVLREKTLKKLFSEKYLMAIWRSVVKSQMRNLDILDLHDYYDFNLPIEERAKEIQSQILRAQYKASNPLIFKIEKRYGICRHAMIPSPSDALIFQTITEHIATQLKDSQPTDKAYYSRDKHHLKLPHQIKEALGYPWFIMWPKFQKDIWKFTDDCSYLVVTDIANFYDNIGLRELRHIVSARIKVEEVILDLLFNIIEQLSWVPDYLPSSLKGLPTINLEAFRLLPHIMLFEVDEVLNKHTDGNFVRWNDDINIGVNSKDDAYAILSDINDLLKSRGLALNLSKTIIYEADEARKHFMVDENIYLDKFTKVDPTLPSFAGRKKRFLSRFSSHLKNSHLRNWDKVTKRYFTVAGQLGIKDLLNRSRSLFIEYPSIRSHILSYIGNRGFSQKTADVILALLRDVKRYDDITLFNFIKLLTNMEIPRTKAGKEFIANVDGILSKARSDFDLYCYFWYLAKYGEPHHLLNTIEKYRKRWKNEQFMARQVVATVPRLFQFRSDSAMRLINEQKIAGPRDAASVASNLDSFLSLETVKGSLHGYLFPPKQQRPYPLPKYLILLCVLSSNNLKRSERRRLSIKVKEHIYDPWYIYWLKKGKHIVSKSKV
jgi:hypothetical protein